MVVVGLVIISIVGDAGGNWYWHWWWW